jgi:UDP-N-acetylglucosamine diphosphorylase/glucosamine-1-phosphate N-acetyltransferase
MKRWLVLFEDDAWGALAPLTDLVPVPALAFGGSTLVTRWRSAAGLRLIGVHVEGERAKLRPELMESNFSAPAEKDELLLVNAAVLPGEWFAAALGDVGPACFMAGERLALARLPAGQARALLEGGDSLPGAIAALALPARPVTVRLLAHPWDLIDSNAAAIGIDLAGQPGAVRGDVDARACLIEPHRITVEKGAVVDPLVVLDARGGPISIGAGARIRPHTLIEGPCVVGAGTELLGGRIARSTIGPQCRIAGEVEECIWQGFANKRHHGFVGHSVIGEWVNLGALTTTSDLKNNYGAVRVWTSAGERDSGSNKVGAFIGAHVKTGIGTLLPTGSSVGTGANLFGGGRFAPKRVPSFGWWDGESMTEHQFDKFLETARHAMHRRGETLSEAGAEALRRCFEASRAERELS